MGSQPRRARRWPVGQPDKKRDRLNYIGRGGAWRVAWAGRGGVAGLLGLGPGLLGAALY